MLRITFHFLAFYVLFKYMFCWDLSNFGISNDHYIANIAVYHNRAFLALPRDIICENNVSVPSLVEVPWPELNAPLLPLRNKLLENQKWGDCDNLQNAVDLTVEPKKAKLWVLDKGNEFCIAKLVMFNLILNSQEDSCEFEGVPKDGLSVVIIDPHATSNGLRAYVANVEDNALLVISLDELKWWRLKLQEPNNPSLYITVNYLAIAKTKSVLYMTGKHSEELFSLDLNLIQQSEEPLAVESENVVIRTNVSLLGNKLGISSGLETDFKSGLIYYLIRDYAVVRWIIGKPLQAEYHSVLAQSYQKLPYVSQIFTGPHNNVWALVNPFNPEACIKETAENEFPMNRVVKILKYNIFGN